MLPNSLLQRDISLLRSMPRSQYLAIGSAVLLLLLVTSGIRPFDRTTWMLEVLPIAQISQISICDDQQPNPTVQGTLRDKNSQRLKS